MVPEVTADVTKETCQSSPIVQHLEVAKATIKEEYEDEDDESQRIDDGKNSGLEDNKSSGRNVQEWLQGDDHFLPNVAGFPNSFQIPTRPADKFVNFRTPEATKVVPSSNENRPDMQLPIFATMDKYLARQTIPKHLPDFSGQCEEWPMFVTQFNRTTQLLGLSNDENLNLEIMFGRTDQIIKSLIQKVQSTPPPKEGKPESLILYSNHVANLVSTMKTMKKVAHMTNPQLLEDILAKLPYHLQFQWCRHVIGHPSDPTLDELSFWLAEMALTASMMPSFNVTSNEYVPKFNDKKEKKHVLNVVNVEQKDCTKCNKNGHRLDCCKKFQSDNRKNRWQLVKENKLCISCLQAGHRIDSCLNKKVCGKDDCEKFHHELLHKSSHKMYDAETKPEVVMMNDNLRPEMRRNVHLKVIPVLLQGPKGEVKVNAVMDDGSTLSLIDARLAKTLGLSGPNVPLCMQWTDESQICEENSEKVNLKIRGVDENSKTFVMKGVRTSFNSALPMHIVNMDDLRKRFPHLSDVDFNLIKDQRPLLLIGHDNIQLCLPRKCRFGSWNDPIASKTLLGWVVYGDIPAVSRRINESVLFHHCDGDQELNEMVRESFSTEAFGVEIPEQTRHSRDDARSLKLLENTTKKIGDRYQTGLLWKSDNIVMPESRFAALRRLHCLEKKMDRNKDFATIYTQKINEFLEKGYAKLLTTEEVETTGPRTWYIPHFSVTNPNKPGKDRLVFDAASKCEGVSLNSCLLSGPDLLNSLPAILLRFRVHPIAAVGDIREMFPQIEICCEDQDSQRFLWRGSCRSSPPLEYRMVRMIFGAASSPTSANFVKNLNAAVNKDEFSEVYHAIINNTYMDDHLDGAADVETLSNHLKNVIEVYARGGFHICNWCCSSPEVLATIPVDRRAKGCVDRRSAYRANFRTNIGWDDCLSKELFLEWKSWLSLLQRVKSYSVPRCYHANLRSAESVQLHIFCDASEEAFASVAYLRMKFIFGVKTTMVVAKTKVSPLKPLSVPRLELQAAVMGVRLARCVKSQIGITIDSLHFWSDSRIVLFWIRSDARRYKQFVANRIGEILEDSNVDDWRWVPTLDNVADEATRSNQECNFSDSSRWLEGPAFLTQPEDQWPNEIMTELSTPIEEIKKEFVMLSTDDPFEDKFLLPDISRFSNFNRMIRATAYVRKLVYVKTGRDLELALNRDDLHWAESNWWKKVQNDSFRTERILLQQQKHLDASSRLYKLAVFLDNEGFIRVRVRAVHLELAADLSTSAAINAFRRFIGRRGIPDDIYSDNGTNFKGASRELKLAIQELENDKIVEAALVKGCTWHFIPPGSPHMGGAWERLVRSVKLALQVTLKERVPREDVLQTLLVEAEAVVNSRPLTFVSVDANDPESLTPNHFLLGKNNALYSPGIFSDDDAKIRNQWKFSQKLADLFWSRWLKEYLPTLTRRTKWFTPAVPIK
ncbi:unnamed protein product, partial [Allacma fusca]